ncbi:hypothetical protein GCM10008937_10950 [Deinococcus depolymerans]|uniref:Secreted protein n=1 Tax=Deinococcus depolymerans TaxID=392408 RepID=A0ABP3LSR1_9DEIO
MSMALYASLMKCPAVTATAMAAAWRVAVAETLACIWAARYCAAGGKGGGLGTKWPGMSGLTGRLRRTSPDGSTLNEGVGRRCDSRARAGCLA